jgi:hypothetical protein
LTLGTNSSLPCSLGGGKKTAQTLTLFILGDKSSTNSKALQIFFFAAMKLQLLFTFCSALVHSSVANHDFVVFCNLAEATVEPGELSEFTRVPGDCLLPVPDGSQTMDEAIIVALDECILDVADEGVTMEGFYPTERRELSGEDMIPQQERILHPCDTCCCSNYICQMIGWCGSNNSCGTMSCERRLEERRTTEAEQDLSAKCTEAVQTVAAAYTDTTCLGYDPSLITCTVTETAQEQ